MGIITLISNFFSAFGSAIGLVKQRDAELNAPAMVAGKVAQAEQTRKDGEAKALAGNDLEEIRRRDAE